MLALGMSSYALAQGFPAQASGKTVAEKLGYPKDARLLVIHAQDLGLAHSVDTATFEALEKGWVTSASILVPAPWYREVVQWTRSHPNADLGVRLDMIANYPTYRWRAISEQKPGSGLVDEQGYLPALPRNISRNVKTEDVLTEARAQMERAKVDGIPISHVDNYAKTLILTPALFQVYWKMGEEYKAPIVFPSRQVEQKGVKAGSGNQYSFGGLAVSLDQFPVNSVTEIFGGYTKKDWLSVYEKSLSNLPPGVYQLCVHLGHDNEELEAVTGRSGDWGAEWRQNDYDVVSSPEFQKFLKEQGIILVGWKELEKAVPARP
jgi:predicted glycoside hydrolase/deacetylase ChbG (UPF0249 family)